MQNSLKNFVKAGQFYKAYKIVEKSYEGKSEEDNVNLYTLFLSLSYTEENICAYSFACYLICADDYSWNHAWAKFILETSFCYINGAYQSAYYHQRKSIELDPSNIILQSELLWFHPLPENPIGREELREIAKKVLRARPRHKKAAEIIKETADLENRGAKRKFSLLRKIKPPLKELIETGRLIRTRNSIASIDSSALHDLCIEIATSSKNICVYDFVWYLMQKKECSLYHEWLAEITQIIFNQYNGFQETLFFHTRRASMLAPQNISLQEKLLDLYKTTPQSFEEGEAHKIAANVLKHLPESSIAQKILNTTT